MDYAIPFTIAPNVHNNAPSHKQRPNTQKAMQTLFKYINAKEGAKPKNGTKGVFGELLLHSLCQRMFNTTELCCKIYFSEGRSQQLGFDLVHYREEDSTLWLGEAKCYSHFKRGIQEAFKSLNEHFEYNYLKNKEREAHTRGELAVISNYVASGLPNYSYKSDVIEFLNKRSVDDIVKEVMVPILVISQHKSLSNHVEESEEFVKNFNQIHTENVAKLTTLLQETDPSIQKLNFQIMLLPVYKTDDLILKFEELVRNEAKAGIRNKSWYKENE